MTVRNDDPEFIRDPKEIEDSEEMMNLDQLLRKRMRNEKYGLFYYQKGMGSDCCPACLRLHPR